MQRNAPSRRPRFVVPTRIRRVIRIPQRKPKVSLVVKKQTTPVVVKKPVKPKVDWFELVRDDIFSTFMRVYAIPSVLISSFIVYFFVTTYLVDTAWADKGVSLEFCKKVLDTNKCNEIKVFVPRVASAVAYLPAILAAPKGKRLITYFLVSLWCAVVPESSVLQYILQASLLSLYLRVTSGATKILLVVLVFVLYKIGYLIK